ncbi:protein phosphatase 2C domain-containing protein [Streptomyces sp. NBC_00728]
MSQQGEKPTGHEDDWWGQLYGDSTEDTGPAAVADSLDDRFASASGTVGGGLDPGGPEPSPDPRSASDPASAVRRGSVRRSGEPGPGRPPYPERPPAVPDSPVPGAGGRPPFPRQPPAVPGQAGDRPASAARPGATPYDETASRPGRWERGPVPSPDSDPAPPGRGGPPSEPPEPSSWEPTPWEPAPWEPPHWEPPPPGRAPEPAAPLPPGPKPPGFTTREPGPDAPRAARSDMSAESPAANDPTVNNPPVRDPAPDNSAPDNSAVRDSDVHDPAVYGPVAPVHTAPESAGRMSVPPEPAGQAPAVPKTAGQVPTAPEPAGQVPPARPPSGVPPKPVSAPAVPPGPAPTVLPSTTGGFRTPPPEPAPEYLPADRPRETVLSVVQPPPPVGHVGSGPPTYAPEPTALPPAEPDELEDLVADTVLDGARYGASTLRAMSVRGDSARYRGEPRRDALLTARFGAGERALVLVAMATGARATPGAHRAAAEACRWIGQAVGRSHERLADDIRAARRGDLKSGLHRLTDRSLGRLRASAAEQGVEPEEYAAGLRCLLLPADPDCRTRVFFGVGAGGLFRLRDGEWQDIEPRVADTAGEAVVGYGSLPHETPEGDRLTMDLGITTPPSPYEPAPRPPHAPFRFRASVARPGDTLLLCTSGLAEPLRGEPELAEYLTARWSQGEPPGLAAFLADSSVRVKGYADDRTAAAVWEA